MHPTNRTKRWPSWLLCGAMSTAAGCHDGPMYGLKVINPYYSLKEWREDEKLGVTDHTRRSELAKLERALPSLEPPRQAYWLEHCQKIMDHDASPEMRRLAVKAAGQLDQEAANEIIRQGLGDDSMKVRMAVCETLGNRRDDEAVRLLAETAGTTTDVDVRHAAFAALGQHQNPVATDALRIALDDRNPATRALAVKSLRRNTGKNYGDDPQQWIAALKGEDIPEQPTRIADRAQEFFR